VKILDPPVVHPYLERTTKFALGPGEEFRRSPCQGGGAGQPSLTWCCATWKELYDSIGVILWCGGPLSGTVRCRLVDVGDDPVPAFLHMSALSTLRRTCCHGLSFSPQCGQASGARGARSGRGDCTAVSGFSITPLFECPLILIVSGSAESYVTRERELLRGLLSEKPVPVEITPDARGGRQ